MFGILDLNLHLIRARTYPRRYCCNDAKMQAKRVAATTGILTVGVAAASIAAAGLLVYFIGKVTLSVVAAPPRAIMKARKRRRLQRELRRRQQDLRRDGCACYFPLDGGGCMFCGRINPYVTLRHLEIAHIQFFFFVTLLLKFAPCFDIGCGCHCTLYIVHEYSCRESIFR